MFKKILFATTAFCAVFTFFACSGVFVGHRALSHQLKLTGLSGMGMRPKP